jgi:hypothetical protein
VIAGTSLIKTDSSGNLQWRSPIKGTLLFNHLTADT